MSLIDMTATGLPQSADLVRTASQSSIRSNPRHRSIQRVRPSNRNSNASLSQSRSRATSPADDTKSLTSFPSLSPSPDASPIPQRLNGWFRSAPAPDENAKSAQTRPNKPTDIAKGMPPPDTVKSITSTVRRVTTSTQQMVGKLVAASAVPDRSALFDDTPAEPREIPGNLHFAGDESLQDVVDQLGAIVLVRQLAGDLAQRDAQITVLRRKAEERERVLRKMLQECEVSNMDIETRLRDFEKSREQENGLTRTRTKGEGALSGLHPDDPMQDRLARAMEDEVVEYPDALGIDSGAGAPLPDTMSITSIASDTVRDTARPTWKNSIWNSTTSKASRASSVASLIEREAESLTAQSRSRASSGAKLSRKTLADDLFVPPTGAVPALRRLHSQEQTRQTSSRRSSSVSLTKWALKMVVGNNSASNHKANPVRGRKHSASDAAERTPSSDSTKTAQSAHSAFTTTQRQGRVLGPNGTVKNLSVDVSKNSTGGNAPNPPSRGTSNPGPVEMDRILPEESRPPTLVLQHNKFVGSSEFLTDRFGFIYDQRRKKRQSEAAATLVKQKRRSNVESIGDGRSVLGKLGLDADADNTTLGISNMDDGTIRPSSSDSDKKHGQQVAKTWADYLKLATHPTELLSHTPSAAPITTVESPEAELLTPRIGQNSITLTKKGSLPSPSINPEPTAARVVSGNTAPSITTTSLGPSTPTTPHPPNIDPVRSLLEQMSELHDNLQKDRTVKWNEFLRKVRAQNKRDGNVVNTVEGGNKANSMPETFLADGEIIGIAGLGNKGKVGRAKWQEIRRLILGGIPVSMRAKIWAEGSGANTLRIPGYYQDLTNNGKDDPVTVSQIQMDITRTLTDNIFFRTGPGVQKLNEVLLAYSRRNPEVGYCQGMNLITAYLLLIMPTEEDAFWVLATMIEDILPEHYYDQHLLTSRADQSVLRAYVSDLLPRLSAHLDELEVELEALTFQWFLSVFTDCLSAEALFRVWDVVLCMHDGSTFLFQVALALLKLNEKALLQCESPAGVYHYINHQMTNHAISIDSLIQASDALGKVIKRKDVEERRARAVTHEQELIRQRDEARQERASKAAGKMPAVEPISSITTNSSVLSSSVQTTLSIASVRSEEEEDADLLNQTLELTVRTPMPIEEEVLWRA